MVRLKRDLERSLRAGHPWIYKDALEPAHLPTGTVVDITHHGHFVARGLFDARSPIAVRVATLDPKELLDEAFVKARVAAALRARRGAFDARETDAFRWLNGEGDRLPGVVVDVYAEVAVLRLDGDAVRAWRPWLTAAIASAGAPLGIRHVYERSRVPPSSSKGGKPPGQGEVLLGGPPPQPIQIREHGVRFAVDVVHGQKTGFFLDQRENRAALRPYARGERVANLFGYTGGFSVYAALAGAEEVATVDSASGALTDARTNFLLNGLDPARHRFDCEDAFDWLARARDEGRRYGLVITDPPSFAPSEKALKKALSAYRDLNALALATVAPEGVLAAASCSSHVTMEAFLGTLRDAADKARRPLRILEVRGQPADHPTLPAFPEGRYLKMVVCRAAS